jgi:hypothetical protein
MKTLVESLFDKDIVSSNLNIEKLLKSKVTVSDIIELIGGINEEDYDDIKNQYLVKWADDFFNKYYRGKRRMSWIGLCGLYKPNEESCREAINWIKFNKIHTSVCWNDQMYASALDIDFFDKDSENIFEWIMFSARTVYGSCVAYLLVNRKEYDEFDQKVIHKLIEVIERNKKGTR